jgi:hypothetical protein
VQVALDSPTAAPIGSFTVTNTGGWQNWTTVTTDISKVTGIHKLYLTFASTQAGDFTNLNWFYFAGGHGPIDATSRIRAENFDSNRGVKTEPTLDEGGGNNIGWIANGDWIGFDNVDFHSDGMTKFTARVASGAPDGLSGQVQVRIDSSTATPVGSFTITNIGGWQTWKTVTTDITQVTGVHTLYVTFASDRPEEFVNLNWFTFSRDPPPRTGKYKSVMYFCNWVS